MSPFHRHRWFAAAAGITLAFAGVCLVGHRSAGLSAFSDIASMGVMLAATGGSLANVLTRPRQERSFWTLLTLGFSLWSANLGAWVYQEIVRHQEVPDPYFFDIILFFHLLPMIAAVAWRPDLLKKAGRTYLSTVNFLMLLGWWLFLYAFIVFPHQYVVLNVSLYNRYYDWLYRLESVLLLVVLGVAWLTSSDGWKRLYLHLFSATLMYCVGSEFFDYAVLNNTYYSGSLYDVYLVGASCWMAAAVFSAREWDLKSVEFRVDPRWKGLLPRLAMLAILSLPVLGLWTVLWDASSPASREFRVFTVLTAMLFLGAFVFLRQYLQDQALIGLLQESRRGYESQKRLQSQLVQKEKLASLGTLVAGAAHEIDYPLTAIMSFLRTVVGQGTSQRRTEFSAPKDCESGDADAGAGFKPIELRPTSTGKQNGGGSEGVAAARCADAGVATYGGKHSREDVRGARFSAGTG